MVSQLPRQIGQGMNVMVFGVLFPLDTLSEILSFFLALKLVSFTRNTVRVMRKPAYLLHFSLAILIERPPFQLHAMFYRLVQCVI
jgi:hypothetical protein